MIKVTAPLTVGCSRRQPRDFPGARACLITRLPPLNTRFPSQGAAFVAPLVTRSSGTQNNQLRFSHRQWSSSFIYWQKQTWKQMNFPINFRASEIYHRKSPWWLSQTLALHYHERKEKKPFKILLNPTDNICLFLLLLLLRPTSVCPAAVLEIRH